MQLKTDRRSKSTKFCRRQNVRHLLCQIDEVCASRKLRRRSVRKTLLINAREKFRNNNLVNIKKRRSIRKKIRNKFGIKSFDFNGSVGGNQSSGLSSVGSRSAGSSGSPVSPDSSSAGSSGSPVATIWDKFKSALSPTTSNHKKYVKQLNDLVGPLYIKTDVSVTSKDVLFIIDMQYDFVDNKFTEYTNVPSNRVFNTTGSLSAPESNDIIDPIITTIKEFEKADANIIATKDYHPTNHCSFEKPGGYHEHCIIGSKGAKIVNPIFQAIAKYKKSYIAFKGFSQFCDSYSAVPYSSTVKPSSNGKKFPTKRCGDTSSTCKTGSYLVKYTASPYPSTPNAVRAQTSFASVDNNNYIKTRADENKFLKPKPKTNFGLSIPFFKRKPPKNDEGYGGAVYDYDRSPDKEAELQQFNPPSELFKDIENGEKATLQPLIYDKMFQDMNIKIFICGLVGDICVLDTAINLRNIGYINVYILIDLTRMVKIGNKYSLSPKDYADFVKTNGIKIIKSKHIIPTVSVAGSSLNSDSTDYNITKMDKSKINLREAQSFYKLNELYVRPSVDAMQSIVRPSVDAMQSIVPPRNEQEYYGKLDDQIAGISGMLTNKFNNIDTMRSMVGVRSTPSFKNSAEGFNIQTQYKSVDDIIAQITKTCNGIKKLKEFVNKEPEPTPPHTPAAPAAPQPTRAPLPTPAAPAAPLPTRAPLPTPAAPPPTPEPAPATPPRATPPPVRVPAPTNEDSVVTYNFIEDVPPKDKQLSLPGGNVYVRFLAKPFELYMKGSAMDKLRIKEPLVKKKDNYVLFGKYSNTSPMTAVCDISGPYKEVFDITSKNEDVYNKIFYNTGSRVIVAFGLSGSGKTYTLMGTPENPGLIPKFINENTNKTITCQSVQLYEGEMYDTLFNYKPHTSVLENDQDKFTYFNEGKTGINTKMNDDNYVDDFDLDKMNLTTNTFQDYSEFERIYDIIKKNRPTRSTENNPDSSRSHLFIFFKVDNKLVTFVDLGGYEQPKPGSTIQKEVEGNFINGELLVIKETFKQLLSDRSTKNIKEIKKLSSQGGARIGAWKILNKLLFKKPDVKLDIILCTQYYRGSPTYSEQGNFCRDARKNKDLSIMGACNYFSRVWSLTNITLQFGNYLLRGNNLLRTSFGRRRSYHRIRKHTAPPYRKQLKSRMSRKRSKCN